MCTAGVLGLSYSGGKVCLSRTLRGTNVKQFHTNPSYFHTGKHFNHEVAILAEYCTAILSLQVAISVVKGHSELADLHPSSREFGQNPQMFCKQVLPCSSCTLPVHSIHTRPPQVYSEALSGLRALLL